MKVARPRGEVASASEFKSSPRRLLLDTHVWLWWQANDRRLGKKARQLIERAPEVRFSAASMWEIAIKSSLGKLKLPRDADVAGELAAEGFLELSVEIAHANEIRSLPLLHNDPFDRMLVAQARVEGFTLITVDSQLAAYDVAVIDATL